MKSEILELKGLLQDAIAIADKHPLMMPASYVLYLQKALAGLDRKLSAISAAEERSTK